MLKLFLPSLVVALAVSWGFLFQFDDPNGDLERAHKPVQLPLVGWDGAGSDEAAAVAAAVDRFARVLSFPTLANVNEPDNHVSQPAPFQQLHDYLQSAYPLVYSRLEWERVSNYSLLFKWRGTNPALKPVLLISHLDVVPAPDDPARPWSHPPFSGAVADGHVWGRGALDVKVSVVQLLEATSQLLEQGHAPARTILLAFGHDEEVGGQCGAARTAALLASRGVELELSLDEGGFVLTDGLKVGGFPVVPDPVALVGTGEKGMETWEITVTGTGGHSSVPPVDGTSVAARFSKVLATLDSHSTSTLLAPPTSDWLQALAPGVRIPPLRWALQSAGSPTLAPLAGQLLAGAGRDLSALVRTTVAVVGVAAGGHANNVLPQLGTIRVNFRTLPGHDSSVIEEYLAMVARRHAPYVSYRRLGPSAAATPVSPTSGPHFQLVRQVIYETMATERGLGPVAPYLLTGGTDSHHYAHLAGGRVFRFLPQLLDRTAGDMNMIHGVDERISITDFVRGIRFYMRFMQLASEDESAEEGGGGGGSDAATGQRSGPDGGEAAQQ